MPFPLGEPWEGGAQRVCVFGRCGAFVEALSFVEERWGTVGQCPNGAERVSLTREARHQLPDFSSCRGL